MVSGDASESNTLDIWNLAGDAPQPLVEHRMFDARGILAPNGKTLALGTADGMRQSMTSPRATWSSGSPGNWPAPRMSSIAVNWRR